MNKAQKKPTPTPKYGSFTPPRDWRNWTLLYGWPPILGMITQGFAAGLVWYITYTNFGLTDWWSFALGVTAGIATGIAYNILAPWRGWQKIHWIDVLLSADIFWP